MISSWRYIQYLTTNSTTRPEVCCGDRAAQLCATRHDGALSRKRQELAGANATLARRSGRFHDEPNCTFA